MTTISKISDELRGRLDGMSDKALVDVIIIGSDKKDSSPSARYRRAETNEHNAQMIREIKNYFNENDIPVQGVAAVFRTVYGSLTKNQIYDLAEKEYVSTIFENQKIRGI